MKGVDGRVVLHDAAPVPLVPSVGMPATWLGLVDIVVPDGEPGRAVRHVMPLMKAGDGLVDASRTEAFVAWLVNSVLADTAVQAGRGLFRGHAAGLVEPPGAGVRVAITEIGGDASNTSLAVSWGPGKAVIVKIVRRYRPGIHPEVEIGRFLADASVRADVPRLVGWLDYVPNESEGESGPATVAIVHERVEARGSAWEVMMASAAADWPRCLSLAATLGETTARLHAALASRDDEPAFAPEPWTNEAWTAAVGSMRFHAERVLDRVERLREKPPEGLAGDLAAVAAIRSRIVGGFTEQAAEPPSSPRLRVHGDYHLGQVLVGRDEDRCAVIDFEGEPSRSLADRREKTSAAKDIAGMCRSFDYLLRVLAKEGRRPYDAGDLASLESRFLIAYEDASQTLAAERPEPRWWPGDRREADRLLALYKLDKALYELAYEADHRPDWIDVPLAAVASLASGCL